jgi:excisionase family DNA binding protein
MAKVLKKQPTQPRKQAQIQQNDHAVPEPPADDDLIVLSLPRSKWERLQTLLQECEDYFNHLIPGMSQENHAKPQMLFPDLMDMKQAMAYLNLSRRMIEYEVQRRHLRNKHFGRAVRFEKTELDRYKKAH